MRALCALSKVAAFAALLFVLPGVSAANPISSGTLQTNLQLVAPSLSEPAHCRRYLHLSEPAHCRRYLHRHRVCARWRGYCRVWTVRTHRC